VYSVLNVLSNAIENQGSIRGRHALLQHRGISEADKSISLRFFWSHARDNVVFDPHCDVGFQFSIDLLPYLGASEKI